MYSCPIASNIFVGCVRTWDFILVPMKALQCLRARTSARICACQPRPETCKLARVMATNCLNDMELFAETSNWRAPKVCRLQIGGRLLADRLQPRERSRPNNIKQQTFQLLEDRILLRHLSFPAIAREECFGRVIVRNQDGHSSDSKGD